MSITKLLGTVTPGADPIVLSYSQKSFGKRNIDYVVLEVEKGITVSIYLLIPQLKKDSRLPVIIGFA